MPFTRHHRIPCGAYARLAVAAAAAILASCGGAGSNNSQEVASVNLKCASALRGVHCQLLALFRDVSRPPRDVTTEASWRLSGVLGARISPTGVIDGTEGGDVEIHAEYQSHHVRARARLTRDGPGQMLAALRGRVYAETSGDIRPVADARVEVIGGASAGISTTTLGDGSYELIGLVPGDVVVRASRVGYASADGSCQIHPGDNRLSLVISPVAEGGGDAVLARRRAPPSRHLRGAQIVA